MKTPYTPGPWTLHVSRFPNGKLNGEPYVYAPNGPDTHRHIAEPFVDKTAPPEIQSAQMANAKLIACAPELLEALQAATNDIQLFLTTVLNNGKAIAETNSHLAIYRAVIAKALSGKEAA